MIRTIDFQTELNRPERIRQTEHVLMQAAHLSERFRVRVTQGGTPFDLSDQTITGAVLRADGQTISEDFVIEKEVDGTGIVSVTLPADAYAVTGTAILTITATNGDDCPLPLLCVRATVAKVADIPEEEEEVST